MHEVERSRNPAGRENFPFPSFAKETSSESMPVAFKLLACACELLQCVRISGTRTSYGSSHSEDLNNEW